MEVKRPRMRYGTIEKFLNDEDPTRYNFEYEFDERKVKKGHEKVAEYEELKDKPFLRYFTYKAALAKLQEDKDEKYEKAKEYIKSCKVAYPFLCDPDGTGTRGLLIHDIYYHLWNWEKEKKSAYGSINMLVGKTWGTDTINSVQAILDSIVKKELFSGNRCTVEMKKIKKGDVSLRYMLEALAGKESRTELKEILNSTKTLEEYIEIYHTIGNFVLVPAKFNGWRGAKGTIKQGEGARKIRDNWGLSLWGLKDSNIRPNSFMKEWEMSPKEFKSYINIFFLWDYVDSNENPKIIDESNSEEFLKFACAAILRRGHFMVMMLHLRDKLGEEKYFAMMQSVFLGKEKIYKNYGEVFDELKTHLGTKSCLKNFVCAETFETVENLLDKTQKQINEIQLPEVPIEPN